MTGMLTAAMIPSIMSGSLIRATPPAARMSDGTRSNAMTAQAPASSAILACSGVTTSMMTPPLSIWASPFLVAQVEVSAVIGAIQSFNLGGEARPANRHACSPDASELYLGGPPSPAAAPGGARYGAAGEFGSAPAGLGECQNFDRTTTFTEANGHLPHPGIP